MGGVLFGFLAEKEAHPEMSPLYLQGSASPARRFCFFDELEDQFGVLEWEADHDSSSLKMPGDCVMMKQKQEL